MGTFEVSGADGTYSRLVDQGSTIVKDENRNGHVNKTLSHQGDGKLAGVAGTYRSLIDESRFGHVSHLPIGAMGTFEREHAHIEPCCL